MIEWHRNVIELIEQENRLEAKRYARNQNLNVERCDVSCIKTWILGVLKMRRIAKESKENGARRYFTFFVIKKGRANQSERNARIKNAQ